MNGSLLPLGKAAGRASVILSAGSGIASLSLAITGSGGYGRGSLAV